MEGGAYSWSCALTCASSMAQSRYSLNRSCWLVWDIAAQTLGQGVTKHVKEYQYCFSL